MNIIHYIKECKKNFKEKVNEDKDYYYLIVSGNESLDMDSCVSSITFSYLLHCLHNKKICNNNEGIYKILINNNIIYLKVIYRI